MMIKKLYNYCLSFEQKFWNLPFVFELVLSLFFISIPLSYRHVIYRAEDFGLFNSFFAQYFYLSDLFIFLAIFIFGLGLIRGNFILKLSLNRHDKIILSFLLILLIFCFFSSFYAQDRLLSYLFSLRGILYLFILYILIKNYFPIFKAIKFFLYSMVFVAIIGVMQYYFQHSLGLGFLGEVNFDPLTLGISKIEINEIKYIRSYGTFLHPNVFAFFSLISLYLAYFFYKRTLQKKWLYFSILFFIALIFTFSRSVFLSLFLSSLIYVWRNAFTNVFFAKLKRALLPTILGILILLVISPTSMKLLQERIFLSLKDSAIVERMNLMEASFSLISDHPILGVGIGNFPLYLQKYSSDKLMPWNFQPVHNIFLLLGSELGFVPPLIVIFFLLWAYQKIYLLRKQWLFFFDKDLNILLFFCLSSIFTVSFFDHYLITNNSVIFLLIILLTLFSRHLEKSKISLEKIN